MIGVRGNAFNEKPSGKDNSVIEQPVNKKIPLERISIKRIMSKRAFFKSKIKRSKNFSRAWYFTGGFVTSAAVLITIRYLMDNWTSEQVSQPVVQTQSVSNQDIALYLHPGLQEFIERQRQNRTFTGRVKNTIFDGVNFALYTFIAAAVLNLFYYAEGQSISSIKDLLNQDGLWFFKLSYRDIATNLKRLHASVYAFVQDLGYLLSDTQQPSREFIEYFNGDVVADFASVVHGIEDLLAVVSESFFEISSPSKGFEAEIDDVMNQLIEQTNAFADYLESIINKHEKFDMKVLMKNLHILYRKFSITLTGYAAECGSLIFGKELDREELA